MVGHDVLFSTTGVAPFTPIASNLPGSVQSFAWMVPNQPTTQGAIRVVARDAAGNQNGDRSDGVFTIASLPSNQLTVFPSALNVTANQDEDPGPRTLFITSTGSSLSWTVTSSGNFLSLSQASGTTPGSTEVIFQVLGLRPGTYTGSVTIAAPGAAALTVPVNLTIRSVLF